MKRYFIALAAAACLMLSGCSNSSPQESSSSIVEGTNDISPVSTNESGSLIITNSSEPQTINDNDRKEFNEKCEYIIEQVVDSFEQTVGSMLVTEDHSVQITEPNVQYENDDVSLSKIYVIKASGDGEEYRNLWSFLDIYCEDEYAYFQSVKKFITFIDENAIDISGNDSYLISINSDKRSGFSDINVSRNEYGIDIVYGNRNICAAYSDRLKNMELLKDSNESLSLSGLIKYDDLPKDVVSYDITVEYQGKNLAHRWYKLENGSDDTNFVTYIDDGTYNGISDEELVYYAYNSIFDPQNELKEHSFSSYSFYFAYKSGEELACSITYNPNRRKYSHVSWIGKYEYLNSNPLNQELLKELTEEAPE